MSVADRRIGLEQEFFLVDEEGVISDHSDAYLQRCQEAAAVEGRNPQHFAPEWVKSMVEINTPPAYSVAELACEYLGNLKLALKVAKDMNLRLYPLSTYPLHVMPVIRNKPWYHIQVRTVGFERFMHAAKCTGTHIHLDLPAGIIDRRVGVAYNSTPAAREELLNIYNLATALDPVLIVLSRACPFYEGRVMKLAAHTVRYRGSEVFGWEGVYTHLQAVGGLQPYATDIEQLVELQFARYYAWLEAMEKAGVERDLMQEAGGLLKASWNRVRLNGIGTVEMRGTDSNYPKVILGIVALLYHTAHRVRTEHLTIKPVEGVRKFEVSDRTLAVPDFKYLDGDLLYAAVSEGVESSEVVAYLDSIFEFAVAEGGDGSDYLASLKSSLGTYQTTEAEILEKYFPTTEEISKEDGLRLVRQCCDKLDQQVASLESPLELDKI